LTCQNTDKISFNFIWGYSLNIYLKGRIKIRKRDKNKDDKNINNFDIFKVHFNCAWTAHFADKQSF